MLSGGAFSKNVNRAVKNLYNEAYKKTAKALKKPAIGSEFTDKASSIKVKPEVQKIYDEIELNKHLNNLDKNGKSSVVNKPKTVDNIYTKKEALISVQKLPEAIQDNVKKFYKKGSNVYTDFKVEKLDTGNYLVQMTKPGNVQGSKAIYYKEISADGHTLKVYKNSFTPKGELIHSKEK